MQSFFDEIRMTKRNNSIFKVNSTPVHPKVEFTLENHRSGIYFDRKTK